MRRICLRVIDIFHKERTIDACPRQLSNGVKGGAESIVHAIRSISTKMPQTNFVILTLDASNAYNTIDRSNTLDIIYSRVPELYNAAYNT